MPLEAPVTTATLPFNLSPMCITSLWVSDLQRDTYSLFRILAYEDALHKRPSKPEYGGTTVFADGPEALGRAELFAKEYPDGWVYVHVEYREDEEYIATEEASLARHPQA